MITVIIPALNEEATIRNVVRIAKNSPRVNEVIVVDDKSMDNTIEEAKKEGATVITSTRLGKGTSMKEGLLVAKNDVVAFLDADINTYPHNVVDLLTEPIINNVSDFVKSFFARQAGRVTELVAKPLLSILYPSFPKFVQPLSGMIAGRKKLLLECEFEEGYGVDIGILMDMHHLGARIMEVSIGMIENKMQALEQLGKMSVEVTKTILKKSFLTGSHNNIKAFQTDLIIREQMDFVYKDGLNSLNKIAIFDMDNTILSKSFIKYAADEFGFRNKLTDIVRNSKNPFIRTKNIARLLKGKSYGDIIAITDNIPVTPHLTELIAELKQQGYITGIISDSYDCITNHIKNKFGFDFTMSNELEFSKSVATGEVKIPSFFLPAENSHCQHEYCKLNALVRICEKFNVDLKNTLVIGDGDNDICMIRKSGIGISFCANNAYLDAVAGYIVKEPDFSSIIPILKELKEPQHSLIN